MAISINRGVTARRLQGPGDTFAGFGVEGAGAPEPVDPDLSGELRQRVDPAVLGLVPGDVVALVSPTGQPVGLPAEPVISPNGGLVHDESPLSGAVPVATATVGPTGRPRRPLLEPAPLDTHGPARILAVCNQKGGVGKTTTTINLGAALAGYGRRVLLVDLDPQGALSVGLGVRAADLDLTVHNLLLEPDVTADDVLLKTGVVGLDLLPSNIDLSYAELQLVGEVAREMTLARVLAPLVPDYDFILLDCQPSLGLLTVNALTAAHGVVIPLECEWFALRGVQLLTDTIKKIQSRLNPQLKIEGVLATMFDSRTLHTRQVVERLVEAFGDVLFDSVIGRTIKFPDATVAGEPITTFAPSSTAATAYRDLAKEVLAR